MEPNTDKMLKVKIQEAENTHADWNRNKVLAGLNFAPKPKKKKKLIFFYSAAASLLFLFLLQYNWETNTPSYHTRSEKSKNDIFKESPASKEIISEPTQNMVAATSTELKKVKKDIQKLVQKEPFALDEVVLNAIENISLTEPNSTETAILKPSIKKVSTRKKIEPIVGVAYNEEIKSKIQKTLPFQLDIGKQQGNTSTVDNTTLSVLKTTLN